jgi:LmbE family N-acetylglucosaminyl deacetylase
LIAMVRPVLACLAASFVLTATAGAEQAASRTLAVILAHPDDEGAASPVLARYAREGAKVYLVIATDGAAGGQQTSIPRGPELAKARAEEARCATDALGLQPPVLLGFPDGQLGNYAEEPTRLFRVTQRIYEELQKIRPDALVTWGPDGGTGHPDHRLVSALVTQLARTAAPGIPERLFYMSLSAEVMRAVNPTRGEPPLLIPHPRHMTARISFTAADLDAARRSLSCHKTQFPPEVMTRLTDAAKQAWNGVITLVPAFGGGAATDLFH